MTAYGAWGDRQRVPGGLPPQRPDQAIQTRTRSGTGPAPQTVVIIGRTVIVFGPAGATVGVFVYAAGTSPGLGNPPIFSVTAGTSDPYGNSVKPGGVSFDLSSHLGAQLFDGSLTFFSASSPAFINPSVGAQPLATGSSVSLNSGIGTSGHSGSDLVMQDDMTSGRPRALLTGGDLDVQTVGFGLRVGEGSNAKQGTATLVGGTILVSNTSVTANSRIFLTAQDNNSTGALRISARVAGTSFTITSSNAADTGVVAYEIFEPA